MIDTSNFVTFLIKICLSYNKFFAVCSDFFQTNFFKTFKNCYLNLNEGPLLKFSF